MTGGWLTPEDQAMVDAASALSPPPHEQREALRKAWAAQHQPDPGMPAGGSSQASAITLSPPPAADAPLRAASEPASGARELLPGRHVLAGGQADPLPAGEPGRERPVPRPGQPTRDQAATLARGQLWAPPDDLPRAQQQILALLRARTVTVGDVLASRDGAARLTGVGLMLEAACGPDVAPALAGQAGIGPGSRVGDLSDVQRGRLLEAVSACNRVGGSRADA
jgi:hypothetical protein